MPIVKCQHCAKEFAVKPSRLEQGKGKFCSVKCRRNGSFIKCQQCGIEFYAQKSLLQSGRKKFCSRECADLAKTELTGSEHPLWNKEELNCKICGSVFYRQPNLRAKYCSRECRNIALANRRKDSHPRWIGDDLAKTCPVCHKEFKVRPSLLEQRFCSRECKYKWQGETFRGKNSHRWKGGFSRLPYPKRWTPELKEKIRQRDNETCTICERPGIDVHHIDYNKKNVNDNNLVTLCRSCHSKTNYQRPYWSARLCDLVQCLPYYGFERS